MSTGLILISFQLSKDAFREAGKGGGMEGDRDREMHGK